MAITLAYPNFGLENEVKSMCAIRIVHPLLGSLGIFDQRYGNNLHYEYRFVRHPYDFMRVCTQEIVDIIVIYCLAAFSRRCVTTASAARACPCDRYKRHEHNEKIFSRPLPSRGSRTNSNRCDATDSTANLPYNHRGQQPSVAKT